MIFVGNMLVLFLLSFLGGPVSVGDDPHGLMQLVQDRSLRTSLLGGRYGDYSSALDRRLLGQLTGDLNANAKKGRGVSEGMVTNSLRDGSRGDLLDLFSLLKSTITVATFVTELQTLGPAKAMAEALRWVEGGVIRRSTLRAEAFPSYYQIIERPYRPRLDQSDEDALTHDFDRAQQGMNSSYSRLLSRLQESLF
ncbi:MAG TPA: hypothetical protein VIH99_11850 [Bdellovibrionota bacterium]|jgi:hypothetical protein